MATPDQNMRANDRVEGTKDCMEKPSIIVRALNVLHRFMCIIVRFVLVKLRGEHGKSMPPIDDQLLLESATQIAEQIRTKQVTSTQVLNTFIKRIKQINSLLNCVNDERFEDALKEAAQVDELIESNKYTVDELRESKPFLGVPVSTKDSIGVKGMIQTCGLWLRRNERCTKDADVIQLMRNAGAIPIAITNVPELCMWWESANTIYGRSYNPYDTNRITGGSSGGEGALLAAAGSPIGIGSDIGGSIRIPAMFNGIFGHKPSPYIVSPNGIWPEVTGIEESHALTLGPMCRFACDLSPMLKVLAGDQANILDLDKPVQLSTLKYFYQECDGGAYFVSPVDSDINWAMAKVIYHLQTEVNAKPERVELSQLKDSMPIWMGSIVEKNAKGFDYDLANQNGRINPYIELLKWVFGMSKHTFIALLTAINDRFGIQYGSDIQRSKVKDRDDLRRKFDEMLGDSGVFIYPTHPTVALYHGESIVNAFNAGYTAIFNVLGLPSTAVPLGLGSSGLPIGLQVVANRNQDRLCLAVACELERAFGGWVPPKIN